MVMAVAGVASRLLYCSAVLAPFALNSRCSALVSTDFSEKCYSGVFTKYQIEIFHSPSVFVFTFIWHLHSLNFSHRFPSPTANCIQFIYFRRCEISVRKIGMPKNIFIIFFSFYRSQRFNVCFGSCPNPKKAIISVWRSRIRFHVELTAHTLASHCLNWIQIPDYSFKFLNSFYTFFGCRRQFWMDLFALALMTMNL